MVGRSVCGVGFCAALLAVCGCDVGSSSNEPSEPGAGGTPGAGGSFGVAGEASVGGSIEIPPEPQMEPPDSREPVTAARRPPAISGGTLLVLGDGERVLTADPDRDRLVLLNLEGMYLDAVLELPEGAEPGRAVEDAAGRAHVVLRGTGEVASIDLATSSLAERRAVCATPRGIAFDAATDTLLVACAEGRLVELPAAGGDAAEPVSTDVDVRDVVVAGDRVFATRFRSAELVELGAERQIVERRDLPIASGLVNRALAPGLFEPNVAWRATSLADGSLVVAHQRALRDVVDLTAVPEDTLPPLLKSAPIEDVGSNSEEIALTGRGRRRGGAYNGGGDGCGGIVHSAVSVMKSDGTLVSSPQLAGITLPVDVAVSPQGFVAVAGAGAMDPVTATGVLSSGLNVYDLADLDLARSQDGCLLPAAMPGTNGTPVVAVAFASSLLLAQTREPAGLWVFDAGTLQTVALLRTLSLGSETALDTGHELFHRDAGGGIACASCHPEGTEDAHVWDFSDVGPRRTQPLEVGLAGTAPFHWDGAIADFSALMTEVFSKRMGGLGQTPPRVAALEAYVFGFSPLAPVRASDDEAALRGKELFESAEVGCTTCHAGDQLSTNTTLSVGKGDPTQVPSLRGVAYRAPFMHDGCATTLRDRFEPECGGAAHGDVSALEGTQLDDLVAYLESL